MIERVEIPERPVSRDSNAATYLALYGVGAIGLALLAFLGTLTFGILFFGVVLVVLFVGGLAAFHYVVWGWWLSGLRDEDAAAEDPAPPV